MKDAHRFASLGLSTGRTGQSERHALQSQQPAAVLSAAAGAMQESALNAALITVRQTTGACASNFIFVPYG